MSRLIKQRKRVVAAGLALGVAAAPLLAVAPAQAVVRSDPGYGGFTTDATASPLKLEVFEPAIPIPTEPQMEFDFSYTHVAGSSGPSSTARASAMWPGPAIGEGLKTFGEQLGLPPQLTDGGYPVQVNSEFPSDNTQAASEPMPGMVQRVDSGDKRTVAKAGYTGSGDLAEGDSGDGTATPPPNPLDGLSKGDFSALGGVLTGSTSGNDQHPVQTNPMGAFSTLVDADGMTSVSSTTYDDNQVTATATSRIGELRLLLGLVTLDGINVVTKTVSKADGSVDTHQVADVGSMTIAGQKFAYGPNGFTAAGSTTPVPGLPTQATDLLKQLGIQIEVPKPVVSTDGGVGKIDAEAVRITLDTKPLRAVLPTLPLDQLVNNLPDMGQANVLKGLILSLNTIAPRLVLHLGQASVTSTTVPAMDLGGADSPAAASGTAGTAAAAAGPPAGAPPAASAAPGAAPAASTPAGATTPIKTMSAVPGLPPLGGVPGMLLLLGLVFASGAGWYLRRAGGLLFGAGSSCIHGLKAGIPDLRKA
ncbi:MAG TPA: choice-of-anchor P family protein [Marmoricola sp.]|nr:choice-of-anchor P family protein [Marmoricola sp.]